MMKTSIALLVCATAMISAPALAANITYTGSRQLGNIAANFSITTDGTLGNLTGANIIDFNAILSSGNTIFTINPTTGSATGPFIATQSDLTADPYEIFDIASNASQQGASIARILFAGRGANAQLFDGSDFFYGGNRISSSAFATAATPIVDTPAVPEPATWAMMTLGFGAMGFAMRRKKVATRIRFA